MKLFVFLCFLLVGILVNESHSARLAARNDHNYGVMLSNFVTISGAFEFYFHHAHNLLLTVHHNDCYYTRIEDHTKYAEFLAIAPEYMEMAVEIAVRDSANLHHTTLNNMRVTFGDLLADYHCINKQVYTLNADSLDIGAFGPCYDGECEK